MSETRLAEVFARAAFEAVRRMLLPSETERDEGGDTPRRTPGEDPAESNASDAPAPAPDRRSGGGDPGGMA